MATNKYQAVKTEIANQLPSLIAGDPGHSSRHYERLFLASNPTLNTLGDQIRKGKFRKTVLEDKVNDVIIDLHHKLQVQKVGVCLLYTSPSPRDRTRSRMPSSA